MQLVAVLIPSIISYFHKDQMTFVVKKGHLSPKNFGQLWDRTHDLWTINSQKGIIQRLSQLSH